MGCYFSYRLHPFTLFELPEKMTLEEGFKRLLEFGGFPEPFLDGSLTFANRWRRARQELVIQQDLRTLEPVRQIDLIDLLVDLLKTRVGGPVVFSHLANDLQVSPNTIKHWISLLEKMYVIFLVKPYSKNLARANVKAPKVFFYDIADVQSNDEGARFENLVACHLLKKLHYWEDVLGDKCELRTLSDKEQREVDFVIIRNTKIYELIEVKWSDHKVSTHLQYYAQKLQPLKATQIVAKIKHPYQVGKLIVKDALSALSSLGE